MDSPQFTSTSQRRFLLGSKGFTLIEVMIAVLILAIISMLTTSNIQRSLKVKAKIDQDIEDYASLRNALHVMSHDIESSFHWVDITEEVKKKLIEEAQAKNKPVPFQQTAPNAQRIPTEKLTAFIGNSDSLYVTTLSNVRTMVDVSESDQAKIGYYLKDHKSLKTQQSSKALIRRKSTVLDDDVTKGGKETLLLEGVKTLKFRYLGGDNKDWTDTWKSLESLDDKTKNRFPNAVEITITQKRGDKEFTLSTIAAIKMPNNDPFKKPDASPKPGGGQ